MNPIPCPNCSRRLQAPDDSGDHRVVCANCGVAFEIISESGGVHTIDTSFTGEAPSEPRPPFAEEEKPPAWLPLIDANVYEDEGSKRTRRIHKCFVVGFLGSVTFFGIQILTDRKLSSGGPEFFAVLIAIGFVSCLIGGGFALVMGNLIGYQPESNKRGEEALARMQKALREEAPAALDDGTTCPPDTTSPSPTDVRPNEPPG